MKKTNEDWREYPEIRVLLTATNRMVEADDDIHNVDLYPEAVRALDKLRPERAPHRVVEYVPRSALDAMRAERDEARAMGDRLRAHCATAEDERNEAKIDRIMATLDALDSKHVAALALSTGLAECERLRGEERRLGHLANSLDADMAEMRAERDEARTVAAFCEAGLRAAADPDLRLADTKQAVRSALDAGLAKVARGWYEHLIQSRDKAEAERDEARRQAAEAYERAAKVCADYGNEIRWKENAMGAWECASRIRALAAKGGVR